LTRQNKSLDEVKECEPGQRNWPHNCQQSCVRATFRALSPPEHWHLRHFSESSKKIKELVLFSLIDPTHPSVKRRKNIFLPVELWNLKYKNNEIDRPGGSRTLRERPLLPSLNPSTAKRVYP